MPCCGNLIARSLALVAIATGAAFVHWGLEPLTLTLGGTDAQGAPPGGPPSVRQGDEGVGQPAPGDGGAQGGDAPSQAAQFDPAALGSEIRTADAFALWSLGVVAFIDARPQEEYEVGHVPGAFLVPAESIDSGRLGDMMDLGGVDPSMRVVVYCEGGLCDASKLVALTLQDMGFKQLHIDVDGFPAWQAAGYEIETGPDAVLGEVP